MRVLLMDGVRFLLGALHMESLRDRTNAKMVKKALEILPKGSDALSFAYDGAVQRVENQREGFRLLATRLLGWLTYSERLMTVKEVQHALAIEPETPDLDEDNLSDINEIVGFCAGLVVIDGETQIIRLVHYTTQEYFRRNGERLLASAQQDIAISCLTYLLYDRFGHGWVTEADSEEEPDSNEGSNPEIDPDDEEDRDELSVINKENDWPPSMSVKDRLQKYPFLGYAATYCANHSGVGGQQKVKNLMISFAKDDRRVSSASQVIFSLDLDRSGFLTYVDTTRTRNPLSALHFFAYLGQEEWILELLDYGFRADAEDSTHRTPLWWALSRGHQAVAKLLLSQSNANLNSRGLIKPFGEIYQATPLGLAASLGNDKIVELLIQCKAVDVNLPNGSDVSPLSSAAYRGHSTIVALLLTRSEIDVNSKDFRGRTSLWNAVYWGNEDIVRQLVKKKDIQINAVDEDSRSPLAIAAGQGHEGIVKILLGHADIDVNNGDIYGRTPIMDAVSPGFHDRNEAVVKLLLSHTDIEVNQTDNHDQTVLHYAARECLSSTVKLLISRTDIDVDVKDHNGCTPLQVAVDTRNEASVRTLLEHADIEINAKTSMGRTPLVQAIVQGSAEIVELLCAHPDVDLNPTDKRGLDVFALVKEQQESIAKSAAYEEEIKARKLLALEERLQILRTAIAKR